MKHLTILTLMVTYYFSISDVLSLVCPEDFCSTVTCKNETCEAGQILQPGGTCSCCNVCHTVLREGAPCHLMAILSPEPDRVVCGEDLICFDNKCQKEKSVVSEIAAYNNE